MNTGGSRVTGGRIGVSAYTALLLLAVIGCEGTHHAEEVAEAPKPVPVTVAEVVRRPVERTVEVTGSLKGWEDVTVGAKLSGRVVQVLHDIGDRVEPDELLVRMDTVDAELAAEQAKKQLQAELAKLGLEELPGQDFNVEKIPAVVQAQIAMEQADRNHSRERSLLQRGAGTTQAYQDAESALRSSEAALSNAILTTRSTLANAQAARVALDVARQALADLEIRVPRPSAPPPGHSSDDVSYAVTKRLVSEGQMLAVGEDVFDLVIDDPLRLWANIPEGFRPDVVLEQPVRVRVPAYPGRDFEGRVARINPAIDITSRTFQVEVSVPNPDGLLRPGGFARGSILTRAEDGAITVPIESIVEFAGVVKVFVVEGDKARAIEVRKVIEGPGWVEVVGNLTEEDLVVITGQTKLAEGTAVVIRDPKAVPNAPETASPGATAAH